MPDQLDEVSRFIENLFLADPYRSKPMDIRVNYQQYSNSPRRSDSSKNHLFEYVNVSLINQQPYKKFSALFDNYQAITGQRESLDDILQQKEIDDFLQLLFRDPIFRKTYDFLKSKNIQSTVSQSQFEAFFKKLWFDNYSRKRGVLDTSSFEHVFIGEVTTTVNNTKEIGGLHNWFRFYQLEKSGALDYAGYVLKRRNLIAMIQFAWMDAWKPSGGFVIGSSPFFDICIYTICFLTRPGFKKCRFELDGCQVQVTTHPLVQNGKTFVGTAFPSAGPTSFTCR